MQNEVSRKQEYTKMALNDQGPVMDVSPWPKGQGFAGSDAWWQYMLSKDERRRLDNLMGVALLDEEIRGRLVEQRDNTLMEAFGLSTETQGWLRTIQADSLVELAQAIVSAPQAEYAR